MKFLPLIWSNLQRWRLRTVLTLLSVLSVLMSIFIEDEPRIVGDSEAVARSADGPLASPELFVIISLPKRGTGTDANVPLRGVEPIAFQVHDEIKLVEGRRFESGCNEIIVGVGAASECAGLTMGSKLQVGRAEWTVVGRFQANGGLAESEIWTDASVLQGAYQRGHSYQRIP